jgi:hypothetical protein
LSYENENGIIAALRCDDFYLENLPNELKILTRDETLQQVVSVKKIELKQTRCSKYIQKKGAMEM